MNTWINYFLKMDLSRSNLINVKHLPRLNEFLQYLFVSIRVALTDELIHIPPIRSVPGRLELDDEDPVQQYLKGALESKEFNQNTLNKWLDSLEIYRLNPKQIFWEGYLNSSFLSLRKF